MMEQAIVHGFAVLQKWDFMLKRDFMELKLLSGDGELPSQPSFSSWLPSRAALIVQYILVISIEIQPSPASIIINIIKQHILKVSASPIEGDAGKALESHEKCFLQLESSSKEEVQVAPSVLGVGFRYCCGFLVSLGGQESGDILILQVHKSHLSGYYEAEGCEKVLWPTGIFFLVVWAENVPLWKLLSLASYTSRCDPEAVVYFLEHKEAKFC